MKTLVSWHAYTNDFHQGKVIEEGPTVGFHDHFYKHDRHILLSTGHSQEDDLRVLHLRTFLIKRVPNRVLEIRYMDIKDVINQSEIRAKIDPLLVSLGEDEIDIFVSPGTPAMQIAWHLSHMSLNLRTTLYQTRAALHTQKKDKPELIKINLERSALCQLQRSTRRRMSSVLPLPMRIILLHLPFRKFMTMPLKSRKQIKLR
jgi:hypothetical protein